MKKLVTAFVGGLFCSFVLLNGLSAQTQEKGVPVPTETTDDLSPFPFGEAPEEKKTIGQKVKEKIQNDQAAHENKSKESVSEQPIRFYEFEDVTFADREEMEFEEVEEDDGYELIEEGNTYKKEYYKDVTFADEATDGKPAFDDQTYSTYQEIEGFKTYDEMVSGDDYFKKTVEEKPTRSKRPVVVKDKDFYKRDYMDYYNNRKKKGNGEPGSLPDFSEEISDAKRKIRKRIKEEAGKRY